MGRPRWVAPAVVWLPRVGETSFFCCNLAAGIQFLLMPLLFRHEYFIDLFLRFLFGCICPLLFLDFFLWCWAVVAWEKTIGFPPRSSSIFGWRNVETGETGESGPQWRRHRPSVEIVGTS